jgi:hypothetical protein
MVHLSGYKQMKQYLVSVNTRNPLAFCRIESPGIPGDVAMLQSAQYRSLMKLRTARNFSPAIFRCH